MKSDSYRKTRYVVLAVALGMLPYVSMANEHHKVVDGVSIYVGVTPAGMIQAHHAMDSTEGQMHGGVPRSAHRDHLVVALFDSTTGKRITDARVTATMREVNLAGETKALDPMDIAKTITWGNYFDLRNNNTYLVELKIRRPGDPHIIRAEFWHKHY